MRELKKVIIYVLLLIGAVIMIAPFAWMIVTSFKMPSEVNSWPPRWTTGSFATRRIVKIIPSTGTSSTVKGLSLREALSFIAKKSPGLNFTVNDDPFNRGTLSIPLKGARYSPGVDINSFKNFLSQLVVPKGFNVDTQKPEEFFESVLLYYKNGSNPYFKRDIFIDGLIGSLTSLSDAIDTLSTFGIERIANDDERIRFQNFLNEVLKDIELLISELQRYKAGTELVLSDKEIAEIRDMLGKYNFIYSGTNEISHNYNNAVTNGIGNYVVNIDFYLKVYKYFSDIQREISDVDVVAVPLSNKERTELLIKRSKDLRDRELIERAIRNSSLSNVVEEVAKNLDDTILMNYNVNSGDLATLKALIGNLISLASENGLDSQTLLSVSFENFTKTLEETLGFNLTYSATKSKLDAFSQEITDADKVFRDIALNALELQMLRSIYERTYYAWRILSAPSFVKEVLVKEGKNIEIIMDGVHPVYFIDDNITTAKLNFSTSDVFKNIFQNYALAWKAAPFGRYYLNTVFIAVVTTILEIIVSAMAAYAFSWMQFPGKNILFSIFLATMMVPGEVLLVPNFITITKFGWIDTYYALIIPWIVSVFSIFLMRQHFMSIPTELFDAAKIDGSSHWRFLWQIVVPLSKPVIITSALLKFVGSWNSFLWVLIVTNSPKYRTLTVGLQAFSSDVGTLYNLLMAAATFSILPVVIIFLFTQKYFVRGIARTGLK